MREKLGSCLVAMALAGCGGGSNVTYYRMAQSAAGAMTGTNCPEAGNIVETYSGIDGKGEFAIWAQPGQSYLLDLGNGQGFTGTLTSGTYTFSGTQAVDYRTTPDMTTKTMTTITLTPSGSGMTGTFTVEETCQMSAGNTGCALNTPQSFASYNCTQSNNITAVMLPAPKQIMAEGTETVTSPSSPQPPAGQ